MLRDPTKPRPPAPVQAAPPGAPGTPAPPGACGQSSSRGATRCPRAPPHSSTVAPPSASGAVVIGSVAALAHSGSRKAIAFAQALLMLSLCACSSTKAAKTPPPADYQVTVKTEDAPPAAPTPPPAPKPEPAPAPAVKTAPPAPAPGPVVVIPAPSATPPPGNDKAPKTTAGATSDPAAPAPGSSQPVVRIRQTQTAPAGQPTPQSPGRLVVFNFDNADIEIVLQATSELLVFNYVLAPGARGKKVTVQTTGRIPVDDIFPVLLTILDVNGLAAVKSGNVWRIIPKEGAVQTSTRTIVGAQLDPGVPGDEVITQLIPLQFTSATDVLNLLRPFVPPQGAITATRDTNLLVVTDAAANIRRLLDILKLVDVDVALNELQILPLKNADAQEVAQILTQLFASGRFRPAGGAQLPAGRRAARGAARRAGRAPRRPGSASRRVRTRAPIARRSSCRSGARTPSSSTRANRRWKPSPVSSRSSTRTSTAGNASSSTSPRTPRRRISRPRSTPSSGAARDRPLRPRAPHDLDDPADDDGLAGLAEPVEHRGITDPAHRLDGRHRSGSELPRGRRPGRRDPLHPRRGDELDHRHDLPAGLDRGRGHHQEARPDAASGPDRGARRRGHARRQHETRASVGDPAWALLRKPDQPAETATLPAKPADLIPPFGNAARVPRPDSTSSPSPPASSWPPSMHWRRTTRSTCCRARRS